MKSIRTMLFVVLLSTVVLVGCGNNSTPGNPPAIPTVSGLPEGEGICFGSGPEHEDGKFSIINFFTSVKMAHL